MPLEKTFLIVLVFLYFGPTIGFLTVALGSFWMGCGILCVWLFLCLYLLSGVWQS